MTSIRALAAGLGVSWSLTEAYGAVPDRNATNPGAEVSRIEDAETVSDLLLGAERLATN